MLRKSISLPIIAVTLVVSPHVLAQAAAEYGSGYGALEAFDEAGMKSMPLWLNVWIGIMLAAFASSLLFVWTQPIARWAIGGFLMPFLVMSHIISALGWPFLSGSIALAHLIFWTPALFLLLFHRPFLNEENSSAFRIWSAIMTAVILFSFIFDVRDTVIYVSHFSG